MSKDGDPRFKPPEKREYKGLSFEEAKELIGDAFTSEDMHAWHLLNMAVARKGKEWVKKHKAAYHERGIAG